MSGKNLNLIGERIKELRTERKLSQAELGRLLAVSQDTVSLWEKSKSLPPADVIVELSKIFEVTCDYLLGVENY